MGFTVTVRHSVTCIESFYKIRLTKSNVCFILVTEQMFCEKRRTNYGKR